MTDNENVKISGKINSNTTQSLTLIPQQSVLLQNDGMIWNTYNL
jgi:hypothetical protein